MIYGINVNMWMEDNIYMFDVGCYMVEIIVDMGGEDMIDFGN